MKVNNLENKFISLEIIGNHLGQYREINNLEIIGISDGISNENLKEKLIQVLNEIQVNASRSDIKGCNRIGKSKSKSKSESKSKSSSKTNFTIQ